jgi:hypothetical protein
MVAALASCGAALQLGPPSSGGPPHMPAGSPEAQLQLAHGLMEVSMNYI